MAKKHLKRIFAPNVWPIERKSRGKWITRPTPGPHSLGASVSINTLFKELLKIALTTKETKAILNDKIVRVNSKLVKNHKYPIGLFDIIEIKDKKYQLLFNIKGKFTLKETNLETRPLKIVNKSFLKKNKLQLNFCDGTNLIIDKDSYKTGDSVFIKDKKIIKHLKFEKGCTIFLTGGKHIGKTGILDEVITARGSESDRILFLQGGEKHWTLKKYAFVTEAQK